jgi:hypothetical protein
MDQCSEVIIYLWATYLPLKKALQTLYPEKTFDYKKPHSYWKDKQNQKAFFDRLAIKWNIQKPEDWNTVTVYMVLKEGGKFISHYYNNSVKQGKVQGNYIGDSIILLFTTRLYRRFYRNIVAGSFKTLLQCCDRISCTI